MMGKSFSDPEIQLPAMEDETGGTEMSTIYTAEKTAESSKSDGLLKPENRDDGSNVVYAILALAAVAFGVATYFLLNAAQEKEFQSEFQSYAREAASIAENNAEKIFGQMRSLSTAITSIGSLSGFPDVSIPHFDLRAEEISESSGAEMILFAPFVERERRPGWESFAMEAQKTRISQDYEYGGWNASNTDTVPASIHECTWCESDERRGFVDADGFMESILKNRTYDSEDFKVPISQYGPCATDSSLALFDLFSHPIFKKEIVASLEYDVPVISEVSDVSFLLDHIKPSSFNYSDGALRSFTLDQVKEDFSENARTMGYVIGVIPWDAIFVNLLPRDVNGIVVVVESDCGSVFTFVANGGKPVTSELGDTHDTKAEFEAMAIRSQFFAKKHPKGTSRHCHFDLVIYPSEEFRSSFDSDAPVLYSGIVFAIFVFTSIIFFLYNKYVQRKQEKVMSQAKRAEAIVTSVFPREVGLRLIEQAKEDEVKRTPSSKNLLNSFLTNGSAVVGTGGVTERQQRSKPIAELFPSTTVMFADITGFTAWSSMREPSQVFVLLESIYREFDAIAQRRKVFKVETVGDCYVAVCGLPEPRKDHALVMSLFAADCLMTMSVQVKALEVELGPDTTELGLRIGLHSGPVTAGVLRGERARFQLFGDTVNTCARMESTGAKNRIQISKETADLLVRRDKGHWFTPREDKVMAKGKGELQTYWLKNIRDGAGQSVASMQSTPSLPKPSFSSEFRPEEFRVKAVRRHSLNGALSRKIQLKKDEKFNRLVNWLVDALMSYLMQIEERRQQVGGKSDSWEKIHKLEKELLVPAESGRTAMDEVVEIVELPRFNARAEGNRCESKPNMSLQVYEQLSDYVRTIGKMYNDNAFHNFEHASHVTMSVMKLLGRIVAPDIGHGDERELHDHTYGITSDPLTRFAVVFSALLHDVDHMGVPNSQLVKEDISIARLYNNKSVAEQNSIDLAWALLMQDRFKILRQAIYSTKAELRRFRQLVVNTILATDIMDKELKTLRNSRWDKAFSDSAGEGAESSMDTTNRKATIVIEHLIQASDISHTMQHWQVYRKWNARLFQEMYKAFQEGRSSKDPAEFWYQGELDFFDYYIIPLARKLESCGVFGVSSHEYLNYAEQNRKEWQAKGQSVLEGLVQNAQWQEDFNSELKRSESMGFQDFAKGRPKYGTTLR